MRLFLAKGRESPYSVATLGCSPVPFNALRVKPSPVKPSIFSTARASGWRGAYSPESQIRARVWTFQKDEEINIDFFIRRLQQAQSWRDWVAQRRSGRIPSDRRRVRRLAGHHYRSLPEFPGAAAAVRRCRIPAPGPAFRPATLLPGMFDLRSLRRCGAQKKACRWRRARCWAICRRNCCRSPNTA